MVPTLNTVVGSRTFVAHDGKKKSCLFHGRYLPPGTPAYIPQNDPLIALIILNRHVGSFRKKLCPLGGLVPAARFGGLDRQMCSGTPQDFGPTRGVAGGGAGGLLVSGLRPGVPMACFQHHAAQRHAHSINECPHGGCSCQTQVFIALPYLFLGLVPFGALQFCCTFSNNTIHV